MPKASEVAAELRMLADCLDRDPEAVISKPDVRFSCLYIADPVRNLKAICRILPRPLKKRVDDIGGQPWLYFDYSGKNLDVSAYIRQKDACTLVEPARPAVYRCDPVLSEVEEEEILS